MAVQVDAMLTAMPIFSALPASVFPVSQRRLSCQSLKGYVSQVPKSCLQGNASPACLEETCPSFLWSQSQRSQRTKSGLRVFGFCAVTPLAKANTLPGRTGIEDYLKHVNLSDEVCFLGPGSCHDDLWDRMFSPCFNDV